MKRWSVLDSLISQTKVLIQEREQCRVSCQELKEVLKQMETVAANHECIPFELAPPLTFKGKQMP